jgi:hypothetical protein
VNRFGGKKEEEFFKDLDTGMSMGQSDVRE